MRVISVRNISLFFFRHSDADLNIILLANRKSLFPGTNAFLREVLPLQTSLPDEVTDRDLSLFFFEHVASSSERMDKFFILTVVDFFSEITDINVHNVGPAFVVEIPHVIFDFFS